MKNFFLLALLCLCTIGCTIQDDIESFSLATTNRSSSKLLIKLYQGGDSTQIAADKFIAEYIGNDFEVMVINGNDTVNYQNNDKAFVRSELNKLRITTSSQVVTDQTSAVIILNNNGLQADLYPANQNITSVLIVGDESDGF